MNILMLIMNLLPTILNAIVSVEQAFPGAPGAAKKSVVMGRCSKPRSSPTVLPRRPMSSCPR